MRALALLAAVPILTLASAASADTLLEGRDWRRADRPMRASPQNYAFELRLGPYQPQVDDEFSSGKTPFKDTFGDGKGFHIGFEIDWQALRIPYVGSFGPGFGLGWTRRSATAKVAEGAHAGEDSAQSTSLLIIPMHLDGVLRVDVLSREAKIPLVPYGKLGLGFAFWRAASDNGVSTADGEVGKGRTWGTHLALGGMLHLDPLDPSAAMGFDEELGVNNSYLFFEWQWLALNGQFIESRPQMHVGTTGWVAGLAFEF